MGGKILLVDDVTMFLEIQKGFLKMSAAQLLTARNGAEAVEVVHRERPDLVFMDLHMPVMDGAEACRAMKQSEPRLPVVLITAAGKDDDRELCLGTGCDAFLTKPLDRDLFLGTARKYLPSIDRREVRIPCSLPVKFKLFGVTLSGTIVDISSRGIYVAADYPVEARTVLEVSFVLPDGKDTLIDTRGRICWVNTGHDRAKGNVPPGFGVELTLLPREAAAALRSYVEIRKARLEPPATSRASTAS